MDRETALQKIRKCLALAKSSEPHEAAAAMRQAQKLMQQFGIEHPEIQAASISEEWSRSGASKTPPRFEVHLASLICDTFGCAMIFKRQLSKSQCAIEGGYAFIAAAPIPEIAAYTFTVLRRQLLKARTEYIKTALKRHTKNKTAAADLFCHGWVRAVHRQVQQIVITPEQTDAINAYKRVNYAETSTLKTREREISGGGNTDAHVRNGFLEGRNARLNRAVGGQQQALLGQGQ